MVNVNGDVRIGLFAREDIEPQTEVSFLIIQPFVVLCIADFLMKSLDSLLSFQLFFDYRYDVAMDNALITKPGMTVDWMLDPKMANRVRKSVD